MEEQKRPPGTGWTRQRERWRVMVSLPPNLAQKVGEEAESLGVSPAVLITTMVGRHYADKKGA